MSASMQGSNFVEFFDSVIKNHNVLIDHPLDDLSGIERNVIVPPGKPGLVHPKDIDRQTGIPKSVRPPNEYGNRELWRYWEPDADIVIPCRSYIHLLAQPCWDGKFHLNDSYPKLGIRPVRTENIKPTVKVSWDDDFITLEILLDGETTVRKWPKKISDFSGND